VFHPNGEFIGTISKHFGLLNSNILLTNADNKEVYVIQEPKNNDWSMLKILEDEKKVGFIKRRSACKLGKTVDVIFPATSDLNARLLLLSTALCIDMLWSDNDTFHMTP